MLSDIIGTVLESAGDIRVVGAAYTPAQLQELTRRLRPDVVIIGLDTPVFPEYGWELYATDPFLRVLGVVGEGRQTFIYELRPHQSPLGELSPDELIAVVRRMADSRASAGLRGAAR